MSADLSTLPTSPIRVMIADDHRFFRDGVRVMLQSQPDIEVVCEAGSGEECIRLAGVCQPRIILMDVQMPGINGMEATRRITQTHPGIGIIILSMFEDTDMLLTAMRAGARGYILKDADEEELVRSVRAAARGEALFAPAMANRLIGYLTTSTPASPKNAFPQLSEREYEVMEFLARRLENQEIADAMGLSLKTVRNHVSSILAKLSLSDREEVAQRAREAGIGVNK